MFRNYSVLNVAQKISTRIAKNCSFITFTSLIFKTKHIKSRSVSVLSNMIATSHMRLFDFKLIKNKNSVPQLHQPCFKSSKFTSCYLSDSEVSNISSVQKVLLESTALDGQTEFSFKRKLKYFNRYLFR